MDPKQKIDELEAKYQALYAESCRLKEESEAVQKELAGVVISSLFTEERMKDVTWEWSGESYLDARMSNGGFEELDAKVRPWYHDQFHLGDMTISFNDGAVRLHAHPVKDFRAGADEILKLIKKYKLKVKTDYMDSRMQKCREEYKKWKRLKRKLEGRVPKAQNVSWGVAQTYNVWLTGYPAHRKIMVIKLLREVTNAGLAEAKRMSETLPVQLRSRVPLDLATKTAKLFSDADAKVLVESVPNEPCTNTNPNG